MYNTVRTIKTAIFISGRGSNMETLIKHSKKKDSKSQITKIFSNNINATGLEIAKRLKIPKTYYFSRNVFEKKIKKNLVDIDLICLAGFMQILSPSFVKEWKGRLINIHPSYLPFFKGI